MPEAPAYLVFRRDKAVFLTAKPLADGSLCFDTDPMLALHFCRKMDAEKIAGTMPFVETEVVSLTAIDPKTDSRVS